jgi:hypothetical protein
MIAARPCASTVRLPARRCRIFCQKATFRAGRRAAASRERRWTSASRGYRRQTTSANVRVAIRRVTGSSPVGGASTRPPGSDPFAASLRMQYGCRDGSQMGRPPMPPGTFGKILFLPGPARLEMRVDPRGRRAPAQGQNWSSARVRPPAVRSPVRPDWRTWRIGGSAPRTPGSTGQPGGAGRARSHRLARGGVAVFAWSEVGRASRSNRSHRRVRRPGG